MNGNLFTEQEPWGEKRGGSNRRDVRIRIVLDDQVNLNMAATVNLSDDGLLITAGVDLRPGTPVTIFPLLNELDAQLFELKGKVVRSFEDIMVAAYSEERFLMGVRLDLNDTQKDALRRYLEGSNN
jgi:hypothetical protein